MGPRLRRVALTTHVACSVGWLGAVAAFLALAVAGLAGRDAERVRGAYLATELLTWSVIVPLCFASLASGLISSLGTPWGLFRHYWVVTKLLLTLVATALLLLHSGPIGQVAEAAAKGALAREEMRSLRLQLVVDAGAAAAVLLLATALGVYKPGGMTPYGWRRQQRPQVQP